MEATEQQGAERVLWEGSPSQILNWKIYLTCVLLCWLIVPIFVMIYKWIELRMRRYTVTTERILYQEGVFSKQRDQIEIYRIKDLQVEEPFFQRLFGRGSVVLDTSDRTHPTFVLKAVPEPTVLADVVRGAVEERRRVRGVREIDLDTDAQ